jgi:hypothetical protein
MHRRISALLAILALSLTAALLVGSGSASASVLEPPTGTGDSQVEPGGGGDPEPGPGTGGDPNQPPCDEFTIEPCTSGPDGGGGGDGGGSTQGPLGLPTEEVAERRIAFIRGLAKQLLIEKPKCFDLLSLTDSRSPGELNPLRVLDTVPIRYVNDSTLDLGFSPGLGVNGRIDILNGFFTITFEPAFERRGYIDRSVYFDLPVVQLSVADMQIVAMLHELGHLTGVNVHPNDGRAPLLPVETGQDFNTQIYVNCLDQGAIYQ